MIIFNSIFMSMLFFFFNVPATPEIYTLSLHDALPILWPGEGRRLSRSRAQRARLRERGHAERARRRGRAHLQPTRSEEHTSELQSRPHLVCRLLLEKKKKNTINPHNFTSLPYSIYIHV